MNIAKKLSRKITLAKVVVLIHLFPFKAKMSLQVLVPIQIIQCVPEELILSQNMLLLKNPQFLPNHCEMSKRGAHGISICVNFCVYEGLWNFNNNNMQSTKLF